MGSLYKIVTSAIAGAIISLSGCKVEYVKPEVPLFAETDGSLDDRVTDWFLDTKFVDKYGPEAADLINEVWMHEFGVPIDSRIGVRFVNYFTDGDEFWDVNASSNYDGRKGKGFVIEKFKEVVFRDDLDTSEFFVDGGHELGHLFGNKELFGNYLGARFGVKAPLIFPDFGKDTNYSTFVHGLDQLALARNANLRNEDGLRNEVYGIGSLATLLALNEYSGSFERVHDELINHSNAYIAKAHLIMDYCELQPTVKDVEIYPFDLENSELSVMVTDISYFGVFVSQLFNVVAEQIIQENTRKTGQYSLELVDTLRSLVRHQPYFKEGFNDPYIRSSGIDLSKIPTGK